MHTSILTFHGTDEGIFHFPAILRFAAQLPTPQLGNYSSATTPLFHLVFSVIGELIGFDLYKLRAFNALFSFLATWVYYRIWTEQFEMDRRSALLITMLFLISPYFFGVSFILLTDNLAWLFCLLTIYNLLAGVRTGSMRSWCMASLCLCLALLTRQTLSWLMLGAVPMVLFHFQKTSDRVMRVGLLGLACLPLAVLIFKWHGLVPPSFQTAHEAHAFLNLQAIEFVLAVTGLYFPLLQSRQFLGLVRHPDRMTIGALLAGLSLLVILPVGQLAFNDGFIWRISRSMPYVHDSSLIFWGLVPIGMLGVVHMLRRTPTGLGIWMLLAFTVSMLPSSVLFQKYFDPFIPVFILLAGENRRQLAPGESGIVIALILGFIAYALLPYGMAHSA
ncbi:glycosyltransferase family 39 protein [Aquabacterium sp.]|uniref:glycosyltransferase family 39 protein n=1 Tax=Aquabacterium sp. TaxID=1872578 RepID=UPI0025C3A77F|nr:glycosyltransferase family 39 protein [Aquabacterium sp.]